MTAPFQRLADLDKLVHEPARLAILTALSACESADFLYLQGLTGLTKGNLSTHLSRLEEGGLIRIEKGFVGKTPRTRAFLTPEGQARIDGYWSALDRTRREAERWDPGDDGRG